MTTATASRHPWFGLHLPNYTHPDVPPEHLFDRVVEQAQAAEAAGFEVVTVMDHLYQIPGIGPTAEPMLEAGPCSARWPARPRRSAWARS